MAGRVGSDDLTSHFLRSSLFSPLFSANSASSAFIFSLLTSVPSVFRSLRTLCYRPSPLPLKTRHLTTENGKLFPLPPCYHNSCAPMTPSPNSAHADYLVIGSGVAGVRAAIELSQFRHRPSPRQIRSLRIRHRLRPRRHRRSPLRRRRNRPSRTGHPQRGRWPLPPRTRLHPRRRRPQVHHPTNRMGHRIRSCRRQARLHP